MMNDLMLERINEILTNVTSVNSKKFGGKLDDDDVNFIKKRVCGEGHPISDECTKLTDSVSLCSLHVLRKQVILETNNKRKREDDPVIIKSVDTDLAGYLLSDYEKNKIDKVQGSLERQLELFPDSPIMLSKNVDIQDGIVNGLTGKYKDSSEKVLVMKLDNGKYIPIPKMRQNIKFNSSGLIYYRIQFPLVDATAQTIHKSQGATLKRCHVSIDNNIFSVGQTYVALSRVRNSQDLHLARFIKDSIKVDHNIVELIDYIKLKKPMKGFKTRNMCPNLPKNHSTSVHENLIKKDQTSLNSQKLIYFENDKINLPGLMEYLQSNHDLRIKNFNLDAIETNLNRNFRNIEQFLFTNKYAIDKSVQSKLHQKFLKESTPVKTPGDGNCLYHMVSLCLFGDKIFSDLLRFIAFFFLIKNKDYYKRIIRSTVIQGRSNHSNLNNEELIEHNFRKLLFDARKNGTWCNEYHLSALSSALNFKIDIYYQMKDLNEAISEEQFYSKFNQNPLSVCHCIKYIPLNEGEKENFICGFYNNQIGNYHYTAILPNSVNVLEYIPRNNFFS
ncbi:unnamed protein product [Brachionus calyciflorus]|uniref:OTU domain-containing protein n=1 Tax=Brachionus calyciflorus TaxID=104777 RepID=A0A814CUW6_9BILA|nr:unnamed protein product [Brachionus calyciflorus]